MSQSRMPLGSELLFPTYFSASNTEVSGADSIDSMFCTEGVGTADGPWYVMLRSDSYGALPALPFPTALPVKGQTAAQSIWVSVNWLIGTGLLPPLQNSYFVAPNGPGLPLSDGSIARPFKTIQEGIDTVPDGSALVIAANTYAEALVLPDSKSLELYGFGGPVLIAPLTTASALKYTATGAGGNIRIGLYHLQFATSGVELAPIPTIDLDFAGLVGASGTVVMNDVDVTRGKNILLALRLTAANLTEMVDVRINASDFRNRTVFFNCGRMSIVNCQLGPVNETFNPTFPFAAVGQVAHRYISTTLGDDGGGPPPESLLLTGAPSIDFDEGCVLSGGITGISLAGFAVPDIMPVILFHGTALRGEIALPVQAPSSATAVVDLDRSQWIGPTGVIVSNAEAGSPPSITARQMNIPQATAALHLSGDNVVMDARGLTGLIEAGGVGPATTCDRDQAKGLSPLTPFLPGTGTVTLEDDFGSPLPFPLNARYLVVAEVDTALTTAVPISTGSHTNTGFLFGFNGPGPIPGYLGTTFLALRFGP